MSTSLGKEYWDDIFEKAKVYNGSYASFCRENNINLSTFYSNRRKRESNKKTVFHEIEFKKEIDKKNTSQTTTDIKIEIGKARIYLNNATPEVFNDFLKEIIKSC